MSLEMVCWPPLNVHFSFQWKKMQIADQAKENEEIKKEKKLRSSQFSIRI